MTKTWLVLPEIDEFSLNRNWLKKAKSKRVVKNALSFQGAGLRHRLRLCREPQKGFLHHILIFFHLLMEKDLQQKHFLE